MLSIIIPSLNEEKYLPLLLESIKRQKFGAGPKGYPGSYEIILADAGSKDKTLEIAKKYGCIITKGGLPAKGRNEGAKIAKGEVLFFLDSDVILPNNFLKKSFQEFYKRNLDIASFSLIPISKSKVSRFFLDVFYNSPSILFENVLPHAAMGIIIKKELFKEIGGFDEEIKLAEDHYLARIAKSLFEAKFGIIKSTKLFISERRFKTDGWIKTGVKCLFCQLHMMFWGPVKSDIFKYKFAHYDKAKK